MKLQLKCETPVHVGSGNELEPFDYVIDGRYLIKFNKKKCFSEIYRHFPEGITAFSQWLEEMAVKMESIEKEKRRAGNDKNLKRNKNQELSDIRKNLNLIYFCENKLKSPELAQEFLTHSEYHDDKIICLEKPRGNRKVREMIREDGRPFIPGSSIKGAIRTALAYSAIKQMGSEDIRVLIKGDPQKGIGGIEKPLDAIGQALKGIKNKLRENDFIDPELKNYQDLVKRHQKSIGEQVERFVFGTGFIDNHNHIKWGDPKFDLLKFLLVSDAYPVQTKLLIGNVSSVTRDRWGKMKPPQSIVLAELFDEGSVLEFECDFTADILLHILQNRRRNEWIGLEQAFKRLFAIDLKQYDLTKEGELRLKEDITQGIYESLNDFSKTILRRDKEWTERFSDGSMSELRQEISNLEKQEKLIRIGFSSGWHSTTVGLALSEKEELRPWLQEIIYAFNLDLIQKQKKLFKAKDKNQRIYRKDKAELNRLLNRASDEKSYPKSRRVLAQNRQPKDWMGWARIEMISEKELSQKNESEKTQNTAADSDDFQKKLLELKKKFSG